jgi:glutamine synthetase
MRESGDEVAERGKAARIATEDEARIFLARHPEIEAVQLVITDPMHASVIDGDGRNLCAAADPAGSALLRHAVGGLRATMAECLAVFAPHANSYRRFRAQSYAPVAPTWGINNRTVSLRVPAGPPDSRHIEHRVAGADANPYLVAAVVLAGMLHGIDAQLDPGPPVAGNGYAQAGESRWTMHWPHALERAAGSEFLRAALGPDFVHVFLAIKRHECEKFGALVTDRDYEWYLDTV